MGIVTGIMLFLRALLGSRAAIAAENLALRQQPAVLQVSSKRRRRRLVMAGLVLVHRSLRRNIAQES